MKTKVNSNLYEVQNKSQFINVTNLKSNQSVRFSSNWLKFDTLEKNTFDSENWVDGSYQNSTPIGYTVNSLIENAIITKDEKGFNRLTVQWSDGSSYQFILELLWDTVLKSDPIEELKRISWNSPQKLQPFEYDRVIDKKNKSALIDCLKSYFIYGMILISHAPPEKDSIKKIAEYLSVIQTTHLEDIFELRVKPNPINFAEIGNDLSLHNDLVYKQKPPAIQLTHVLKQANQGGENIYVDGLHVIQQLSSREIELLSKFPIIFINKTQSIHYQCKKPVLIFDQNNTFQEIHFNKIKTMFPKDLPNEYYAAYAKLESLLESSENSDPSYLIPENSIVMVDNLRILHGRKKFDDPNRHYLSCYIYDEEVKSLYRTLKSQL